ncbi:unnamed protein product, partial [Sphenostylis stenocarpa]
GLVHSNGYDEQRMKMLGSLQLPFSGNVGKGVEDHGAERRMRSAAFDLYHHRVVSVELFGRPGKFLHIRTTVLVDILLSVCGSLTSLLNFKIKK